MHKISIIPRGRALGYTLTLPTEDKFLVTRSELVDELAMLLGGRTAEELIFADPTTGAQNDIDRATTIARQMVTEFGMSDALGPMRFGHPQGEVFLGRDFTSTPDYSDEVAARIDAEVRLLIDARALGRAAVLDDEPRDPRPPRRGAHRARDARSRAGAGALRRRAHVGRRTPAARRARRAPEVRRGAEPQPRAAATQSDPTRRTEEGPRDRAAVDCDAMPDEGDRRHRQRIEAAVREILEAIGEDPDRDGLVRTPTRIAKMYDEIFAGLHEDPSQHLTVTFEADHDEMVMVRDIPVTLDVRAPPRPVRRARRTSPTSPATTAASPGCRRSPASSTASPSGPRCRSGSPPRSPTPSSRCSSRTACS